MIEKELNELKAYFDGYGSRHDETILKLIEQIKRYRELLEKIMYEEQTELEGYESDLHKEIRETLGLSVAEAFGLDGEVNA